FAMADNIGVMSHGQLQQWGSAVDVYGAPATRAVAEFVGEGSWLNAQSLPDGKLQTVLGVLPASHPHYVVQQDVQVLLRPEHVLLSEQGTPAKVVARTFRGSHFVLGLELSQGERLLAQAALHHAPADAAWVHVSLATTLHG
ncbi:MAG: TOBE domain-containing protein, partial [Comamonas sp.]